jgi:spore maturation protein CgeB
MKTFEIPACGGVMFTNQTEEQSLFFRDGQEAIFFNTLEELLDKAKYYLDNDAERKRICQAGLIAVAPHSYDLRALALVNYFNKGELVL